ncbi:glycosyltransferase family 2 protein [Moritella sp. 24]|uniref:glycosyltransferase family 2 protein n=1 Tax=Moritella sp. 24 TaxID=2746230 RepID=UPI001BAB48EB|nr:glycosyltransferase family 2 protein [Moritella sp. 24]QUM77880.1 glycosyltransferase family 2 protein [Moritella sp. 24]
MVLKVAVGVISYNSEKTVLETLDSIINQTYGSNNLTLIISDDGSSDGTVEVIKTWVKEHELKFFKVITLFKVKNEGVSKNFNNVIYNCNTDWIKIIAADDILMKDCIDKNIIFIGQKKSEHIIFSNVYKFKSISDTSSTQLIKHNESFFNLDSCGQYRQLLKSCDLIAPSVFLYVNTIKKIGMANDAYSMIEDYPLWLKLTKNGIKLSYFNDETVYYRVSDSLSKNTEKIGNVKFLNCLESIYKKEIWPNVNFIQVLDQKVMFFSKKITIYLFDNKKSKRSDVFYYCFAILRPLKIVQVIQKVFK